LLIPIYENNRPYPDTIGYYLCHQPQCRPDNCGDYPDVWRLYEIHCQQPNVHKRRGHGTLPPLRTLEKARKELQKLIEQHGLVKVMKEQPTGDWPLAQYADMEQVYVPENPPDPAATCPNRLCPVARKAQGV
jgi:hypothetical protein